uniref:Uncharacterized protein n=1 Tax=Anguilla anguilla TaxID=7936 RepID=A0A0E9Y1Z8_ANGAN
MLHIVLFYVHRGGNNIKLNL